MKVARALLVWAAAAATLVPATEVRAASECAYRWKVDCTAPPPTRGCASGCGAGGGPLGRLGLVVQQLPGPCSTQGGSLNLIGTQYELTCSGFAPGCTVSLPPLRFWDFDNYGGPGGANSGCQLMNAPSDTGWILNGGLDGGFAAGNGHWFLYQTTWSGPGVDGCPTGNRTVIEVSDVSAPAEQSPDHASWYLVASADNDAGFNFDRVAGALASGGCQDNDIPAGPVTDLLLTGRADPCRRSLVVTRGTVNAADARYFDVQVELASPSPPWFSEAGIYGPPALIAGFQVVYASGTEPLSSDPLVAGWLPVRDPAAPTRARAVVPHNTAGPITVTLPSAGGPHWLAARLVYAAGAAVNPLGSFNPSVEPGPRVTSFVGGHCGPVRGDDCLSSLQAVPGLLGVKQGAGAAFSWHRDPAATQYHLNSVTAKAELPEPGPHRSDLPGGLGTSQCEATPPATACADPAAFQDGVLLFYRVLSACGPGGVDEGPP